MPANYERFAQEMTSLNLWYVWQLKRTGRILAEDIAEALTSRVDIYRMTSLWDGVHDPKLGHVDPEWNRITKELTRLILDSPSDDSRAMEERGLAFLWPLLEKRDAYRRLPIIHRPVQPRPFGCWTY